MRPPSRRLAPGDGTARPPPLGRQGARQGTRVPPPLPPPPPPQAREQTEADRRNGGPAPPQRGRCNRAEGAPRPRKAPVRPARCRPTADRRRPGRRKRSGPFRGRPGEDGGANQGGVVPPPPPRTALTHWRPTGPRPSATARVYPGGARQRQRMASPTGQGGGGAAPPPPPRSPPPA